MAGKRKRDVGGNNEVDQSKQTRKVLKATSDITIQIVTGSYEKVLHGIAATVSHVTKEAATTSNNSESVSFADTFLFTAHTSAIRCLAISPLPNAEQAESQKVILASGGTDERVNLYTLSATPTVTNEHLPSVPTLAGNKILENPKNREIGSLLHHSSTISALYFPTRSKLLTGAEDNTISISRTRDWTVVSTIKAPHPKVQGRPSGDTAPPGSVPQGINDFAVHPSNKLMLSVGKGEKCMRLWNLVTGKKAGVLNFGREVLMGVKEGKYSPGEGRRIEWSPDGEEFCVAFERGVVVFGLDSTPRCRILPSPLTKVHQIKYLPASGSEKDYLLAVSTEDGRVVFYDTQNPASEVDKDGAETNSIPLAPARGQFGGKEAGTPVRIKDFQILDVRSRSLDVDFLIVTAHSDGAVRIWGLSRKKLDSASKKSKKSKKQDGASAVVEQAVATCLGTYQSGSRITCLQAFVMLESNGESDSEFDFSEEGSNVEDVSSSEDDE